MPLEFRFCLGNELPPRAFVGSVRALILRGNEVLLVHSSVPILSVGGRCGPGETVEQTLLREVGEETGWRVLPLGVIGFIHCRHLDEQRPSWGRPAPDFIDPLFVVEAQTYDASLLDPQNPCCEFVSVRDVERLGVDEINRTFLEEALRKASRTARDTRERVFQLQETTFAEFQAHRRQQIREHALRRFPSIRAESQQHV